MRALLVTCLAAGCASTPATPPPAPPPGWEVTAIDGLGLFADERAQSRASLERALAARGFTIADSTRIDRAWKLAAEGRNPLTGQACGRALNVWDARRRWGGALGLAGSTSNSVWCPKDAPCELNVHGQPLDRDDDQSRFSLRADVSSEGAPLPALEQALAALAPPAPGDAMAGVLGGLGASNAPPRLEDRLDLDVYPADARVRRAPDGEAQAFPDFTVSHAATCLGPDDDYASVLLEVATSGAPGRCEGAPGDAPAAAACLCAQLGRGPHSAALNGQRWSVRVRIDRKDRLTRDGKFVLTASWNTWTRRVKVPDEKYPRFEEHVEDPSLRGWSTGPARLAAGCFEGRTSAGVVSSRWAVWFDAQGNATRALEQKGWPPLDVDTARCVARVLLTAQAPCPARAGLWAMANLRVNLRDPSVPPPSLQDVLKKAP